MFVIYKQLLNATCTVSRRKQLFTSRHVVRTQFNSCKTKLSGPEWSVVYDEMFVFFTIFVLLGTGLVVKSGSAALGRDRLKVKDMKQRWWQHSRWSTPSFGWLFPVS